METGEWEGTMCRCDRLLSYKKNDVTDENGDLVKARVGRKTCSENYAIYSEDERNCFTSTNIFQGNPYVDLWDGDYFDGKGIKDMPLCSVVQAELQQVEDAHGSDFDIKGVARVDYFTDLMEDMQNLGQYIDPIRYGGVEAYLDIWERSRLPTELRAGTAIGKDGKSMAMHWYHFDPNPESIQNSR